MAELLSVGLDVGTTTTQMILSRLTVENKASSFAVPDMAITDREILYRSEVVFTPLKSGQLVDGEQIRDWVTEQYHNAGISRESVDTGAIIITGETSRKENAQEVLSVLSDFAGDFVVATAGPDLESALAAKGAGAVQYSRDSGKRVLHMDIGGGTSNLSLIEKGKILQTGCMNVGGRLIKTESNGKITYVSSVLQGLTELKIGDYPAECQLESLTQILVHGLEMAAGLRPRTELLERLWTKESGPVWEIPEGELVISFSGGVADCIEKKLDLRGFGDIGPHLGQAIGKSLLCAGEYTLGQETIRATVIGAGCHSAQLSGSTVFCRNIQFPLKNLPVAVFSAEEQEKENFPEIIAARLQQQDGEKIVLVMPGYPAPSYEKVTGLAKKIAAGIGHRDVLVCLENDMAKALGHSLCLLLPESRRCLCIDRVRLEENSFLDVGEPVGPALPVVIKTLILSKEG